MPRRPALPTVDSEGALMALTGVHARGAVLAAFEMIGGVERLADWADENPGEFYTKIFTKTITRSEEVTHKRGIEDELDELEELDDAIDADYEVVEDSAALSGE